MAEPLTPELVEMAERVIAGKIGSSPRIRLLVGKLLDAARAAAPVGEPTIDEQVDAIERAFHPEGRCQVCGGGKPYWKHNANPTEYHAFVSPAPDRAGLREARERVYQTPAEHHHSDGVPCTLPMCAVAFRRDLLDYLDHAPFVPYVADPEWAQQWADAELPARAAALLDVERLIADLDEIVEMAETGGDIPTEVTIIQNKLHRGEYAAPGLDVERLREAARRAPLPDNVTVADIERLAEEYDHG